MSGLNPATSVKNPDLFSSVSLGEVLPDAAEVSTIVTSASEVSAAMSTRLDNIEAKTAEFKASALAQKVAAIHDLRASGLREPDIKKMVAAAEIKANAEATEFRDGLLKADTETNELYLRLDKYRARLASLAATFHSPQALLSVASLGDPKRSEYHKQLAHAGPVELVTLARLAISSGNRALAAAVMAKNDETPRVDRQFSSADFATHIVGKEHATFISAHKSLEATFQKTHNRLRSVTSGKRLSPFEVVKQGLRNHELGI